MKPIARWAVAGLLGMAVVGCGPRVLPGGATPARADPQFISLVEIRDSGESTAYEVVQALRPLWLNKRGAQSIQYDTDILVYMGNARIGELSALRQISAASIASMRFLDAKAANYRFGMGHPNGAIVLSTDFPPGQ
jgi:hypothetical protein